MKSPGLLLIHTCSVVKSGSVDSYGVSAASWDSGTTTTALIACRVMPKEERELATGALLSSHVLIMAYEDAPSSLLAHGAERTHRIADWKRSAGDLVDAGPFDVIGISNAAGHDDHLTLKLLRVG